MRVLPASDTALSESQVLPGPSWMRPGAMPCSPAVACAFTTSAPVHGLRRLLISEARSDELDGGAMRDERRVWQRRAPHPRLPSVASWALPVAGGASRRYAARLMPYARDGGSSLGRDAADQYKICLADQAFRPAAHHAERAAHAGRCAMEGIAQGAGSGAVSRHAVARVCPGHRRAWRQVLRFLSDHTYLVRIPAAALRASVAAVCPRPATSAPVVLPQAGLREMAAPALAPLCRRSAIRSCWGGRGDPSGQAADHRVVV